MDSGSQSRMLIVGGGVGGTAAGVALAQKGIDAVVFEQAPDLSRIHLGGCYVLWYGGVRALAHLGLAEKVQALGHPVERFEMADAQGRAFYSLPVGERGQELEAIPVAVRRADLLGVLSDALDKDRLRLGATFRDAVQDRRTVTATFTNGQQEGGAVLVGADGLGSTVRAHLHGLESPRHPGYGHWTGIAEDVGIPRGTFRVMHGKGARFAFFQLGNGKVCWWCVRNAPEAPVGDLQDSYQWLATFFRRWAPAVGALLTATPPATIHRRDTLDRAPLHRWGEGRITLLGDAAHAMTFDLGQGAGTSLTDAVCLAEHLSRAPVLGALRAYEDLRRFVTTPLVRMSRRVGAVAAWDWPMGPKLNEAFIRTGRRVTPRILERDLRGHPGHRATRLGSDG